MEQSQKTTSETKAKGYGCLWFIEQRGIIELKLLKSISQITVTDKVEVLSSEEGEPVVYTKSQISELIKELKKIVKNM